MESTLKEIFQGIIDGDEPTTVAKVQAAIDDGLDPGAILNQGMVAAMEEVGRLFEAGEYFVPEMLISSRAMQAGMAQLKPQLVEGDFKAVGKVVAGTVQGDLHDIGIHLVCMMLEGAAFEIINLGSYVEPKEFVETVRETGADIVAMSALLTTTMPNMKLTIDALTEAGLRDSVKVMVGGAPLTDKYAREIGADGYAPDASHTVALAKSLDA